MLNYIVIVTRIIRSVFTGGLTTTTNRIELRRNLGPNTIMYNLLLIQAQEVLNIDILLNFGRCVFVIFISATPTHIAYTLGRLSSCMDLLCY